MTIIDKLRNLSDEELLYLADNYHSASEALTFYFEGSSKGQYTKLLNSKLNEYNLEWKKRGILTKKCPVCNKTFTCHASRPKTTCSYSCSNTHFRSGIGNPNWKHDGCTDYRALAFRHYEKVCSKCGFSNELALEVHHKDKNRKNNLLENLEVLCANCHNIEHKTNDCGMEK